MKPMQGKAIAEQWQQLRTALTFYDVASVDGKIAQIDTYAGMMQQRRRWAGLASKSLPENLEGLIVDSVTLLEATEYTEADLVDIGSGGGLVGIVLAIICPTLQVTTVESSGRKSAFLAEVAGALKLSNTEVLRQRAEVMIGEREFDWCVSRAAGRLAELAPLGLGLLKQGGKYIALKSGDVGSEIEEARANIELARGRFSGVFEPRLSRAPDGKPRTSLVVIEKL